MPLVQLEPVQQRYVATVLQTELYLRMEWDKLNILTVTMVTQC